MHHHHGNFKRPSKKKIVYKKQNKFLKFLKTNALVIFTVTGVILGGVLGVVLRQTREWTVREQEYVGYIGQLFLQMLKSLIVPLIVSSLVSAIASMDLTLSGKIARRAIAYYLTTTFAAVILGITLVVSIKPGKHSGYVSPGTDEGIRNITTVDAVLDLIKNMFPPNIFEAIMFQYRTKSSSDDAGSETEVVQTTNILGLVVVSVVTGIALAQLGDEAKTLAKFFHNLMALMMKITMWVIWLSPVGVMFLVAYEILQMDDIGEIMISLGKYFATVCAGLFLQGFVVLPALYYLLTRKNPVTFFMGMGHALATAFGTASSSATLPVTIRCLENNLKIDRRIARFTIPIGATINMDGTALYEAVTAIFIAQLRNVPMDFGTIVAISLTATAASIGAAGIPQAGLVTMVMVLNTVGLDASDISLVLTFDWLLDRFRTAINVLGDSFGAAIVNHRSRKEIDEQDELSVITEEPENFDDSESKDLPE